MKSTRITAIMMAAFLCAGIFSAWAADDILGLWKIIDDKTGKPTAYVLMYPVGGKLYGRMMATISKETGIIDDTIATQKNKAEALAGDPPNCGLDFVYDLQGKGIEWKGSIIDPKDGKEYACTIKRTGDQLVVRGSLKGSGGLLGRNQTWLLASSREMPAGFTIPDPKSFVPKIPKKK